MGLTETTPRPGALPVNPGEHTQLYRLMPSTQAPCIQGLLAQSSKLISQLRPVKRPREMILYYHRNASTSACGAAQSEAEGIPGRPNRTKQRFAKYNPDSRTEKPRGLDYSYLAMICPFYSVVMETAQRQYRQNCQHLCQGPGCRPQPDGHISIHPQPNTHTPTSWLW